MLKYVWNPILYRARTQLKQVLSVSIGVLLCHEALYSQHAIDSQNFCKQCQEFPKWRLQFLSFFFVYVVISEAQWSHTLDCSQILKASSVAG